MESDQQAKGPSPVIPVIPLVLPDTPVPPATAVAVLPLPPEPPPKPPRRVRREKFIKTITLYEKDDDKPNGRRETKIPATVDAARVLSLMTAEKMRTRIEVWLNSVEDQRITPSPKEYKDMMEALKACDDMIKGTMEPAGGGSKPAAQSLILNNSVISTGNGPAPAELMNILKGAAKAEPKHVDLTNATDTRSN